MKLVNNINKLTLTLAVLVVLAAGALGSYLILHPTSDLLHTNLGKNLATSALSTEVSLKDGDSFDLRAAGVLNELAGKVQPMLAYNGSIPGPTLRVKQGDTVHVTFSNKLPMDTTVHAHGLRQDVKMDGTPDMSQPPIKQNGSFTYDWTFPDAGMYWYHPHIREDVQQGSGLYGAIIVEPRVANYWPNADHDQTLILSDALINAKTGELAPFSAAGADHTLMGRYGNILLVNGKQNWSTEVKAGTVQRFYVLNAAAARPFRFAFDGYKLKVVGSDNGRVGVEYWADAVTLSPGERVIVDVKFDKVGKVHLINTPTEASAMLGAINVVASTVPSANSSFEKLRTNNDVIAQIQDLTNKVSNGMRLKLDVQMAMGGGKDMGGMGGSSHMMPDGTMMDSSGRTIPAALAGIEWTDTMSGSGLEGRWQIIDQDSGKANDRVQWAFKRGEVVRITINNSASSMHPMQHPIHIHGQRFAVGKMNGITNANLEWKDTVTIPSGQTYELLVAMDNPGEWMLHCHIAEHLETGMAITFKVEE